MELALSAVQTVFTALQCSQLRDLLSVWGYKSELESLDRTLETIQAVFRTVDGMQAQGVELNPTELDFMEKLKDAVYDADDLLDEFATIAAQQQQQLQNCKKVRRLLSRLEKFGVAYKMSRELKNIRKKLDRIASDVAKYSFKIDNQPIRKRREETCSYVYEQDIIGRDDDKKRVVDMLLESNVEGDVVVLAIVGMGGLGKTALAQLVFDDPRIREEFSLRLWVCVSDQDQNEFNVKPILAGIYKSINPEVDNVGGLGLDDLVRKVREELKKHKYLLVLDDLWTEKHSDWLRLKGYLVDLGQRENKIVVTTRSLGTATAVESNNPYELKALSDEKSWQLFERVVGKEQANYSDFVEIGKNIVKKCANVPLAIRVMGCLLHGQPVNKWKSIQQSRFTEIKNDGNDIAPVLKFSYNHLTPSLKSCFTYCTLFPKDFMIPKWTVIELWIAHKYVEPLDEGQSIEEAAEEYFQILVRRCFFQDVKRSLIGKGLTFKIHDLMHDMGQQASGKEIFIADSGTMELDYKTRHLYDRATYDRTEGFITATTAKIRSYARFRELFDFGFVFANVQFPVRALLVNWRSVRVLDLSHLNITDLPNAIGGLLHLRWLDLSGNMMKMLPKSFTKLINLQFLYLDWCCKLEELPEDFNQLANLRTLWLPFDGPNFIGALRYMPLGMEKMACLTTLNQFTIGQRKSSMKREVRLEDLRVPRNLRGSLRIHIRRDYKHSQEYGRVGYLCDTEYLKSITIMWDPSKCGEGRMGNDDDVGGVVEDLRPHCNLKELSIWNYPGLRIPREDGLAASLANLVKIVLKDCDGLKELPWLGKLQHLKTLELRRLRNLEYVEGKERGTHIGSSSDGAGTAVARSSSTAVEMTESSIFFPSLENLKLIDLRKLKGWWRGIIDGQRASSDGSAQTANVEQLPLFPRLSRVYVSHCPNLRSIPLGPAVDTLNLLDNVSFAAEEDEYEEVVSSRSSHDCGNWRGDDTKIKEITIDNVRFLKSLPMVAFQCFTKMEIIHMHNKVECLSEVGEVFRGCSSSLRFLYVRNCEKLRSISRGLQHLTALESLELFDLPELRFDETQGQEEEQEEEEMPWRCLAQCLHTLKLRFLKKVVNLPKGMRYLTALQSLEIEALPLKGVPEWIGCLPSLQSMKIIKCEHLESLPESLGNLTTLITDARESESMNSRYRWRHAIPQSTIKQGERWWQSVWDSSFVEAGST